MGWKTLRSVSPICSCYFVFQRSLLFARGSLVSSGVTLQQGKARWTSFRKKTCGKNDTGAGTRVAHH